MRVRMSDSDLLYALGTMRHSIGVWKTVAKNPKETMTFQQYSRGRSDGIKYAVKLILAALREGKQSYSK